MSALTRSIRRKLLGVGFLVVLFGLIALSIAFYQHAFTKTVPVTLRAGRIGHQLVVPADVKLRGLIVGTVTGVHSDGSGARMDLQLSPSKVGLIPENVSARILPKTLFGEKFVALEIPANPIGHIKAHDVIPLDRSATAIEAEKVFNDLVPLLRTLQPVELNTALSNLADALSGRGNKLGDNLVRTDTYFKGLNPKIGTIVSDISGLADFADTFDQATPDLLATARQSAVNARTLVAKQDVFASFLQGTRGFADVTTNFLTRNENNLVQLASVSRPTLAVLARYSPEFPCFLEGLAEQHAPTDATFKTPLLGSKPELHIELEVIQQPRAYTYPADKPRFTAYKDPTFTGPHCYGLPKIPTAPVGQPPPDNGPAVASPAVGNPGDTGNPASDLARILAAPQLGVPNSQVPDLVTLLLAPQLAGMGVSVR